jgi:hypothetical protein
MAITNYTELQAAIASWHHRDVTQIPDFISLAEVRINNLFEARMSEVEAALTATISSRYIALPSGYKSQDALWLTTYDPRREVKYLTPNDLPVDDNSNGRPYFYTIDGLNIAFDRPADIAYTYTFRYKKKFDIASTATNDVLTTYPDIYLFASLVEACLFARDDPSIFEQRFQSAIENAQISESKNKRYATIRSEGSLTGSGRYNILNGDL